MFEVLARELKRIFSRPIYLVVIFLLPIICFVFWGTFMKSGLPTEIPVGIVDLDNTSTSRNAVRQIDATQQDKIVAHYANFSEARDAMQRGKIYAFFQIPADFQQDVLSGKQPQIDFYYNSAFLIAGSLVNKDMSIMSATLSGAVTMKTLEAKGMDRQAIMSQLRPITPEFFAIGNPWINYSVYLTNVILPGLLGLIIMLMTVYCIGVELKMSTGRKWLRAADNNLFVAIMGKMLPYVFCFFMVFIACDILLFRILGYPMHNNIWWMFLNSFLFVLANQSLAIFMIEIFPVLRDGLSFASLYGVLSFSFAGLSFPIENMLPFMQTWSYLFPIRHYYLIYQNVALNGFEPSYVFNHYLYLMLFMLLPFLLGGRLKEALIYDRYPKK